MMKLRWAMICVPILLLASCADQSNYIQPIPERESAVRESLLTMIRNGEAERAVANAMRYQREGLFTTEETSLFTTRAASTLHDRLSEAQAERDYVSAISALRSLEVLGENVPEGTPSETELYTLRADSLLESGNEVAALHVLLRAPQWRGLEDDILIRYAGVAVDAGNRRAATALYAELQSRDAETSSDITAFVQSSPSFSEMISGTVTIWVNRGIRLQSGMGLPDRVIGSGFFVDSRGYLVTNYHVIESEVDPEYEGYSRLYVKLPGNPDQKIPARVVGYDRLFDIALLKVEIDPDYVFSFSDIEDLSPGTQIFAIGSPGGLNNSISSGIISAAGRRFLQLGDALQVDVPINPGNSGGPLLDENGDLIGVVFSGIELFEGVNFAIPSHWIQEFVPALYDDGEVVHPWIGVTVHRHRNGLETGYVFPGSPADEAGIRPGDIIRTIADSHAAEVGEAQKTLLKLQPGELVSVTWTRVDEEGTQELTGYLSLGERPYSPIEDALALEEYPQLLPALFGMRVVATDSILWQRNFLVSDILPGSIADETGLSSGDPFTVRGWDVDLENRVAILRLIVRKRKAGFMESAIQLASYLEVDNFL